jgi:hypothetical protein
VAGVLDFDVCSTDGVAHGISIHPCARCPRGLRGVRARARIRIGAKAAMKMNRGPAGLLPSFQHFIRQCFGTGRRGVCPEQLHD